MSVCLCVYACVCVFVSGSVVCLCVSNRILYVEIVRASGQRRSGKSNKMYVLYHSLSKCEGAGVAVLKNLDGPMASIGRGLRRLLS